MKKHLTLVFFAVAVSLFSACTVGRSMIYGGPDITDHKHFTQAPIHRGDSPFEFATGKDAILNRLKYRTTLKGKPDTRTTLDTLLASTKTTAFIIIRNDSILFEHYYGGYDRGKASTIFSVSKTLTCLLAEIAIDEGLIASIDDPVVKYVPEFAWNDPMRNQVTVRHLMDMRAGIRFNEGYGWNPFNKMARMYYGSNTAGQIKKTKIEEQPGTALNYQSIATNVLGLVIENATGMPLAKYMETKVWQPLGMEYDASLSLDNRNTPKAFGGFSVTAIDLAKIGRLYLNNGNRNGKQIIAPAWVKASSTPDIENNGYQLSWRTLLDRVPDSLKQTVHFKDSLSVVARIKELGGDPSLHTVSREKSGGRSGGEVWIGIDYSSGVYYAWGILDQLIYINPAKKLIMVRLGREDKLYDYRYFMDQLATWL